MSEDLTSSRRTVLRTGASLASVGTLGPLAIGETSGSTGSDGPIPQTPEEIRAAFDDVRWNEAPTDSERRVAENRFPDFVVPESGPIPDPVNRVTIQIEAPPWALGTTYDKIRWDIERGGEPDRLSVEDILLENAQAYEEWVLPDGRDAVDAVLEAATDGGRVIGQND